MGKKLLFDYNGWYIKGGLLSHNFKIFSGESMVMRIYEAYDNRTMYILEFDDQNNEVLGLLSLMAIEAILHDEK